MWFKQDVGPSSHLFKQLIVFNLSRSIISLGRSSSGHSSEEISRAAWREIWKVFMSMLTCFQGLTCFLDCVSVPYGVSQEISEETASHTFAFFDKSLQSTFEWLQMLPTKAKALVHEWKEKPPTSCVSRFADVIRWCLVNSSQDLKEKNSCSFLHAVWTMKNHGELTTHHCSIEFNDTIGVFFYNKMPVNSTSVKIMRYCSILL